MKSIRVLTMIPFLFLAGCASNKGVQGDSTPKSSIQTKTSWRSIIGPLELERMMRIDEIVVIDARSASDYEKGHIPGAINLPPTLWRTGKAKPGQGDSQYIFRSVGNEPDVAKYESMLGQAGIRRDDKVVVYGNHGGKADGTVPAMILDGLGQERVSFLDGVGIKVWTEAGMETETTKNTRPPTLYNARPRGKFVWNLPDVLNAVQSGTATFVDTRSLGEYNGSAMRSNSVGGHIPGALRHDTSDLLDGKKCVVDQDTAREQVDLLGLPIDKPVVLYCQTATRVSLNYMVLKDLGYENVSVYDGSWHEYGNTEGVPVEK